MVARQVELPPHGKMSHPVNCCCSHLEPELQVRLTSKLIEYSKVYFSEGIFTVKKTKLFRSVLTQWDFSHGKFRLPFPEKSSCNRVELPNLGCMLGVLVFP